MRELCVNAFRGQICEVFSKAAAAREEKSTKTGEHRAASVRTSHIHSLIKPTAELTRVRHRVNNSNRTVPPGRQQAALKHLTQCKKKKKTENKHHLFTNHKWHPFLGSGPRTPWSGPHSETTITEVWTFRGPHLVSILWATYVGQTSSNSWSYSSPNNPESCRIWTFIYAALNSVWTLQLH